MRKNRKEAREAKDRYYFTGKPCKHGHYSKRFVHNGACYSCVQIASKQVWSRNRYSSLSYRKRRIFNQLKDRALRKGIEFELDFEKIKWPDRCPVLGIKLNYLGRIQTLDSSPSFDRINPQKGYIHNNICIISMRANRIKYDASLEELEAVYKYMREKL